MPVVDPIRTNPKTSLWRQLVVSALVASVIAILLCDLLAIAMSQSRNAEAQERANSVARTFDLSYVPRDAVLVVSTRPAELLSRPALNTLRQPLAELHAAGHFGSLKLEDVAEVRVLVLPIGDRAPASASVMVRVANVQAATALTEFLRPTGNAISYGSTGYFRTESSTSFFQPDPLTFVMAADEPTLRRCVAAGREGATNTSWAERWRAAATRDGVALVNTSLLRAMPLAAAREWVSGPRPDREMQWYFETINRVAPLWQKSDFVVAELIANDHLTMRISSQSISDEQAQQVHDAVLATISFARLALSVGRQSAAADSSPGGYALLGHLDALDAILDKTQVTRQETQVTALARAESGLAGRLVGMVLPTYFAARDTSHRTGSSKNLKQLGLAMHNYHDTYKTFPAATQIGPKNVPHSWRVTLLPFLGHAELYKQYKQDEPWDSPSNRQVLAKMPDVFRFPGDDRTSKNTSYFTIVGKGTVFESERSPHIASITDGTSNTVLLVESKQATPWTKPEDIPFDPDGPLPKLGGWTPNGFSTTFCDGSVRFVPADLPPDVLRRAILRADGEPLNWPR